MELLRRDGKRGLLMLPLVAKDQSIGLVELFATTPVQLTDQRLQLARTMANEAAMALENARLYEDARNLADRDPLTGFYNHRFLHERLGEEVVRAQRARRPLSMLMLDLDDFKLVNDTFGHLFGDRVLTWTAELIRSTLRGSDIPARYGGDEFAIILPETDHDEARRAAERILEAFREKAFVGEQRGPVPISASIGVATYPQHGRTPTELIAASDGALYTVKRDGGHDAVVGRGGRLVPKYRSIPARSTTPRHGRAARGTACSIPNVRRPFSTPSQHTDQHDPRIQRSWWAVAGIFIALGLIAAYRLVSDAGSLLDWLVLALVVAAGAAAIVHRDAVASLEAEQRTEAESFARILSGLSRSVSPDAVVDAIVKELAEATSADHVVVARRRPGSRVLDATLVSSRSGVPDSTMILPISDLEERIDRTADRQLVEAEPVAIPIEPEPVAAVAGAMPGPVPVMAPRAIAQLAEPESLAIAPRSVRGRRPELARPARSRSPTASPRGSAVPTGCATRSRRRSWPTTRSSARSCSRGGWQIRGRPPLAACSTAPPARRPWRCRGPTRIAPRRSMPRSTP